MMFMLTLLKNVGPKLVYLAVIALVVFLSLSWLQDKIVTNAVQEQKIEQIEKEIVIRNKVDEMLQKNYEANPNRDGAIALDRLRSRYRSESGN